ncbi:MAG: transglycosylase domain-containing protein [Bacillota bacterium]|jgi:penicillin-binding protein 1A
MKKFPRWLKILLVVLIILAILSIVGIALASTQLISSLKWEEGSLQGQQTTFLYDKNNNIYQTLHGEEDRISVDLTEISPYLQDCFVASEDARFYKHGGIDIIRIFGAIVANFKSGEFSQGASTITMQLARNAILDDQSKNFGRKIKESFIALELERQYNKDEILEMYLNEIHLGHGCYGVESASLKYFDKHASELTLSEAATIVGLAPNPATYSPIKYPERAVQNRDNVLNDLLKYKPSYAQEITAAKQEELIVKTTLEKSQLYLYPWFTDYVISEAEKILQENDLPQSMVYSGGLRIYTTMDPVTQSKMEEIYNNKNNFPSSRSENIVQSAAVVIDHSNGQIRGLMGGRDYTVKRGLSRATDIARQPGSAFKPIAVYGPALEAGYSPDSMVDDTLTTFGRKYTPKNYDGKYRGLVTMRTAIQYSLNVPAVKFLQKLGVEYCIPYIEKAGIDMSQNLDAGLSMALGGLTTGVSPLELAAAYATFANQGVYIEPIVITKIEDFNGKLLYQAKQNTRRVYTEQNAWLMTSMLMTVTNAGTGTNARMNRPVASKTGTTQLPDTSAFKNIRIGNKDAWFAAYTPELVGVVWMGYDKDLSPSGKPQYLRQIYGGKYPARIWKAIISAALEDEAVKQFPKPDSTYRRVKHLDTKSKQEKEEKPDQGIIILDPDDLPEGEHPVDLNPSQPLGDQPTEPTEQEHYIESLF